MGFPRQEYWNGLLLSSPGDFPHPGIELMSSALASGFFTMELPGKPVYLSIYIYIYVSWVGKISWRRDRLPTPVFLGFPGGSDNKESACNVRDLGLISGLGKSPGGVHGNSLQYFCLENPHGKKSLAGYSPWGHKESDMTEHIL